MFKSTTRRVKGDISAILAGIKFEVITHQAAPAAVLAEPEDEGAYWQALIPSVRGRAMAYSAIGRYPCQDDAVATCREIMLADGWRETREEAEREARDEIERRTKFRADGRLRFKLCGQRGRADCDAGSPYLSPPRGHY